MEDRVVRGDEGHSPGHAVTDTGTGSCGCGGQMAAALAVSTDLFSRSVVHL